MAKQKIKVIREEMLQVANNVAQEKNINQDDVFSAMEQALEKSARVKYGMERDLRVNINRDNGDIKLESYLKVVNTHSEEEQAREILLEDAVKLVYLALGSNLGNKIRNIEIAKFELEKYKIKILKSSSNYISESWPDSSLPDYINVIIKIKTILSPIELLNEILLIEKEGGRIRKMEEGYLSRTIDIDILFYENQTINSDELKIPHPKLHERNFVIKPLLDIAKGKIHPFFKKSILEIGDELKNFSQVVEIKNNLYNPVFNSLEDYNNIVIEGNIGIGKTSLAKKLSKNLNKNLILEGFIDNPFLEKFYQNPKRYALNLELTFLVDRCRQLNDYKNQLDIFKTGVVFDYDIVKSLIFAGVTLNENDFNLYMNIFYFMTKDLLKPNLIIFLMQ